MRRAGTSTMANIAEGFDGGTNREFIRFLKIARRSASELQSHLYVALDRGYLKKTAFDSLYSSAQSIRKLIGGFIRYLADHEGAKDRTGGKSGPNASLAGT